MSTWTPERVAREQRLREQAAVEARRAQAQADYLESIRGKAGDTGPKGDQGPRGERGDPGPAGKDGAAGRNGVDGVNGKDGSAGRDGSDGRDGLTGPPGRDGAAGRDGRQGRDGRDGAAAPIVIHSSLQYDEGGRIASRTSAMSDGTTRTERVIRNAQGRPIGTETT